MGELSNTTINGVSYDFKDAGAARQSHSHTKSQITDFPTSMPASDVSAWAKASTKPTYTASEVGAIATTAKGAASGVAELDANGKVPSSQLPSFVDDVLEYSAKSSFPATGETGKIYVDTSDNKTYRWSGSAYVEISPSLALGETSSTAYRGDRGKTAYDHSQVTSGNPHNVTKTDVGLSNVGNFKAVSTVASQGLSSTEQANARANIGAGTSSFSGSYSDLSGKPTLGTAAAKDVPSSGNASTSQVVMGNDSRLSDARTPTSHTHNYAGSSSAGGAATSANKLNTNAGSATQPVYFSNGVPVATTYTLGKSVPSDAKFTDTTYSVATTSANGLMSSGDKSIVDSLSNSTWTPVTVTGAISGTCSGGYMRIGKLCLLMLYFATGGSEGSISISGLPSAISPGNLAVPICNFTDMSVDGALKIYGTSGKSSTLKAAKKYSINAIYMGT